MGQDFYNCGNCGEIFGDYGHYGHCAGCETTLCGSCYDEAQEMYEPLPEDHPQFGWYQEDAPSKCPCCDGSTPEMVEITKEEYERLLEDSEKLSCLEACGVDNWQGYDDAMEMYRNEDEE
jgi:hypothetical protein